MYSNTKIHCVEKYIQKVWGNALTFGRDNIWCALSANVTELTGLFTIALFFIYLQKLFYDYGFIVETTSRFSKGESDRTAAISVQLFLYRECEIKP